MADPDNEVGDAAVSGVVQHLATHFVPEFGRLGIRKSDSPMFREGVPEGSGTAGAAYLVESTHSRVSGTAQHSFTGVVPMIRLRLPETAAPDGVLLRTPMGDVWARDLKLHSMEVFREYYGDRFGFEPKRVDVWTPPRVDGARFGAILFATVYDGAGWPNVGAVRGFVLGGGMAQGKTRVLYASRGLTPIQSKAGYAATPFTSVDHIYRGNIVLGPSGEPLEIQIDIRPTPFAEVCLTIRARPRKVDMVRHRSPYSMLAEAALRVCAIADAMGTQVPDLGPATKPLAKVARAIYSWHEVPR